MKENKTNDIKLLIGLLALLLVILYIPMFINLYNWWENDPNYGHGLFIPLASAFLVWRKRKILKGTPKKPEVKLSIALFIISFFLYVIGSKIELFRLCIISFLMSSFAFSLFFFGWGVVKELAFPLGFMVFMIPIPRLDDLTAPMKLFASWISAGFLKFVGLSVYREGNVIMLPKFTLEVATACSGLKSLVLVTTLSVFYGYLFLAKNTQRILLFLLSVPIAIIANIARIITVGLISNILSTQALFHFVHDFSGVFVFIVAGVLLALTSGILERCKFQK